MNIVINELSIEQINTALLRITRAIQSNTNNFQNDVEKAVANVTVQSKNTTIHYDDSKLWNVINTIQNDIKNIKITDSAQDSKIANLEALMASINFDYNPDTKVLTLQVGSKTTEIQLIDTTYTFAYDSTTSKLTVTDNITQSAVFDETIVGTTYTFSFANGILTIHNNLLNTDQTFNFDSRYYTESEIQSLILDKIPSEASSTNQLADKDFVNSSISTATATFRGTVTTTQALAALTGDLNDYAFLQNIDPTTGQTLSYDRYKWVESGGDYGHWKYEYTLNNSSFTSDQWAAINSGITCQIVTDLLDGCYSGSGSSLCKSAGNEWRNILATNCDCSGSVDADYIYYNTNVRVNQCTGALNAVCYYVCDKGWVPYSKGNLTASSLGLTAGCCYPITCILDLLRCCFGYMPATYVFQYSNAANPMVCETSGYAYCLSFTKLDAINVTTNTWQRDHWLIEDHVTGKRWTASSYSAATVGTWTWNLNSNRTTCAIYKFRKDADYSYPLIFANNANEDFGCVNVSCGCAITFNPSTGVLSTTCFVGDNQYHAVIPSPDGNTTSYYATIVLESSGTSSEASIVFNSYYAEYHLLTWYNGSSCLTEIKDLWYADCKYNIDSVGVSTCKGNTSCIYIKYCGYRPTIVNSSRKIKCIISGCTTAPSNVSWTTALKGIGCSRDSTCFGGCTYADACADIRSGLISGGSFNGTDGTVSNGCLSFSDINFDNICNSTSKDVAANNITRRHIITNQISSVGYITRWGLGIERGTTGWGTGLLSLGIKDDGTCFADYKFTSNGGISLTCCGTAKCITLSGCATKNVFTCCLASASATTRYFQIKTKANRGSHSVSFDFDFFSMNGTINLDNNGANQYYSGSYYGCLCVSVCGYTCACCDCFWLTYTGYRTLTLKSVYDFEVICNTTTAPTGVTFCCFVKRPGSVTKVDVSDDAPYNVLLSNAANDTAMPSIGSNDKFTFNPSTGILNVSCGTCIGWYRTKSCCVKVTPAAQSSCWIYIGRFQTNGTSDTINTYNGLNLTIAAVGNSMVSSANIKVLSANATSPTVIVQRQAGYSSSTGIDCVAVTRSGSVWNCYVCVWARVKSSGTNAYYVYLYRNMLPDSWGTALTVCSAITGDVVGVGNVGINARAIQSNADLRIGCLTSCTSTVAGCGGSIFGSGYLELFATTPFIDFHVNNAGADCSSRIIASTGSLGFNVNNATGCTASTESAAYTMCSNGLLYSGKGFIAGCVNAACPFMSINCACGQRMISMTKAASADIGLMLSHAADWTGTTYCNLGIEIGSGNVNRGFYHCKAGTFEWLQYWDATCERHACPQCFACPIYGCSSATFADTVSACNTDRWSTVYSSNTYNTGYYLIAEYKTNENGSGNHDITISGCVDVADTNARKPLRFKASIRGNKCTVNYAYAWVDSSLAADYLAFTRSVDTATCTLALRIYAKISSYYTRFNTTIDYLAAGDVNLRKSNYLGCLTFPNTYAANTTAFVGTIIPPTCSCGIVDASYYKTCALSISCSFAAKSTSYILLGCYTPSNIAGCANELDLGVALGGGSLVEKGSLKLLLTTASCTASAFSNNSIEASFSNYVDSCYGVRNLIFTSSGNSWNCNIGIWLQVCNPGSAACTWAVDLLRNKVDDRFTSCLTCASSISGTRVCTIAVPAMRNFYFNNAEQNCFACALSTSILCTDSFRPLPSIICGNCTQCYIHLGCYKPTLLCANELDLTLTVGDAGNNSVNIKALLTTGCLNEFYKNNIRVNTASVDRSHAYIDSVLFTTIGTAWDCSINIYAVVRSTAACTCYTLYNNKQDASFKKCFEVLSSLPPAPLKCSIPVNGDSVTVLSAPLLINTWKQETSASASFALGCNNYTTLIIGGVNDVRSPTYQKLLISTCITGSENPLNMWIDYMGGYGDKDFITACFSGANCNVIIPMRISSDSQNIYIDLATCTCAARDLCATIYSSCPMPLGSCGNSVRTTCYTASFITDSNCAYCYVMCQWPTTITLNVDDPASQFATRILSANTISAYCMATTSDIRQKKDIVPYNNGLCDISKLDIISFRYKNEDSSCIKHVSIPANWTNPLLSGEKQNQLRINDAVGILLGAVKDLSKSMTLSQKIKLWFYKKFIEPKNNDNIKKKLKDFN